MTLPADHSGILCYAVHHDPPGFYICTLPEGHDGDHQAHAAPDLRIVHQWSRTP